jgi:hypothetical protein
MEFLSDNQLGINPKKRRSDSDEEEEDVNANKIIKSTVIGLKEGDQSFEIKGIKKLNEKTGLQREDGYEWEKGQQATEPFQKDWIDKQEIRRKIIENHPDYKFLSKVAGFSNTTVETFFFTEDIEAEYQRRTELYRQYQAKGAKSMMTSEQLYSLLSGKDNELSTIEKDLKENKLAKRSFIEIDLFVESITNWRKNKSTVRRLTLIKRLCTLYRICSGVDSLASLAPSITMESLKQALVETNKVELIKLIQEYVKYTIDVINSKIPRDPSSFKPSDDNSLEHVVREEKMEKSLKSIYKNVMNFESDKPSEVSANLLCEVFVIVTDYIFYTFKEKEFSETTKTDTRLNEYVTEKSRILTSISNTDGELDRRIKKVNLQTSVNIKTIIENYVFFYLMVGSVEAVLAIHREIQNVLNSELEDEDEVYDYKKLLIDFYTDNYKYDKDVLDSLIGAGKTFALIRVNNDIECIDAFSKLMGTILLNKKTTGINVPLLDITTTGTIDNLLDCLEKKFDRRLKENSPTEFGTLYFMEIVESVNNYIAEKKTKGILLPTSISQLSLKLDSDISSPYHLVYYFYRSWLQIEEQQFQSKKIAVQNDLKILKERILEVQSGKPNLDEVKIPYKQRRSWVENPENSGVFRLKPIVIAALAAANNDMRKIKKFNGVDLEEFQRGEAISVDFAKLVAYYILNSKVTHPGQYYPNRFGEELARNKISLLQTIGVRYVVSNRKIVSKTDVSSSVGGVYTGTLPGVFW